MSDSFVTARIISFEEAIFFEVDFGDGTYSDDMLPEDLLVFFLNLLKIVIYFHHITFNDKNYNIETEGIPRSGSQVKVKWTDGSIYSCTFLGTNKSFIYKVSLYLILCN